MVMEQLRIAGTQLRAALDHYLSVCSGIHSLCLDGNARDIPKDYLDDIKNELAHFPSYKPKLREAEIIVTRSRNSLFQFAPVNSLPHEILTNIFHLVLASESCNLELFATADADPETSSSAISSALEESFPKYPDYLIQVCSHWRQVALSCPTLWAHIDFTPNPKSQSRVLARAKVHAARASNAPLTLHIYEGEQIQWNGDDICDFLRIIANQAKALDFTILEYCGSFTTRIFNAILPRCASDSSLLSRLTVAFISVSYKPHLMANEHTGGYSGDVVMDMPLAVLEACFSRISVLQLRGIFPYWSSAAYHGLVDLRLISSTSYNWRSIPELDLINILESSPRLRILYFDLKITDQAPEDGRVTPVCLDDLEVLNTSTDRGNYKVSDLDAVLRLIAPGSRPIRLTVSHRGSHDQDESLSVGEHIKFFQRSNMAGFCVQGECLPLYELLCHAPNLQVLAFDSYHSISKDMGLEAFKSNNPKPLKSLVMHHCCPAPNHLKLLLQRYPSKMLMISGHSGARGEVKLVKKMLSVEYPDTELHVYNDQPESFDPFADWDLL